MTLRTLWRLALMACLITGHAGFAFAESNRFDTTESTALFQDYLRLLKRQTNYVEAQEERLRRFDDVDETEGRGHLKLQLQLKPQWFLKAQHQFWNVSAEERDFSGSHSGNRIGLLRQYEDAGESTIFLEKQKSVVGFNASYSNYLQPVRWRIKIWGHQPWNDSFVTREEEGYFHRAQLSAKATWSSGWLLQGQIRRTHYHLLDSSKETPENQLEATVAKFWLAKLTYGLSYTWQKHMVSSSNLIIDVPEQLNHIYRFLVEHAFSPEWFANFQIGRIHYALTDDRSMLFRGRLTYDPNRRWRYWIAYEQSLSEAILGSVRQHLLQLGIRWNFDN